MKEVSEEEFKKSEEEASKKNFVESSADSKAKAFNPEEDFSGTLLEFDMIFEWNLLDDKKILKCKSNDKPYTGEVHIKDSSLDDLTYPNQEQKIRIENGIVKVIDSRETE
jgi:hypothetical protein